MAAEIFKLDLQFSRDGNNIFVSEILCHLLLCFLLPSQIVEDVYAILPQTIQQYKIFS